MSKAPRSASEARDQIVELLKANPEGLRVHEIIAEVLGNSNDPDEQRRRGTKTSSYLATLYKAGLVRKGPGNHSPYFAADHKHSPEIGDLPVKRRYAKRNGTPQDLKAYIIRDIRAKLAELESLD